MPLHYPPGGGMARKDIEKIRKDMTPDSGFLKQMDAFFSVWGAKPPIRLGGEAPHLCNNHNGVTVQQTQLCDCATLTTL